MAKRQKKRDEEIVKEALRRFETAEEAWKDVFEKAVDDIRFVDGEDQWDEQARRIRKGRPCLTFDRLSGTIDQVVGDHLQSKPGMKVRGAEDDDADSAEIYEGLIRQIEERGRKAYKTAFKFSAKGGYGVWRVRHDYLREDCFDQDILLHEVKNPFSVMVDPIIQVEGNASAQWGFHFADIPKEEFTSEYPKATVAENDFKTVGNWHSWISDETVRIAEYFRLVTVDKTIYQLSTGEVVDAEEYDPIADEKAAKGVSIVNTKTVKAKKLEHFKMTGAEILEEVECIGSYIPLVVLFGKNSNINGEFVTRGMVRKARDAQKMYNYERSAHIELTALSPKSPYLATQAMIQGHEADWQNINTENRPVLFFNFDQGAKPMREAPPQVSSGLLTGLQLSADDIKATTGIFDASLGNRSNETSGKAIRERKQEGDTATYEYTDEFVEALKYTGEIFIQWIPKIYDATRQIRILGEDDAEEVVRINQPEIDYETGQEYVINDLSKGKYDIKITVGPSYSTRRSETAEQLAQIMSQNPEIGQLGADIYYKSLDLVGGDELIERIRKWGIQKGFIEPTEEEQQKLAQDPRTQQAQKMKQAQAQLQMQLAQAKAAVDGAKAKETQSKALLNQVKAQAEQLELAIRQQDMEAQRIAMQRLLGTIGLPLTPDIARLNTTALQA